jgi:hypothetical protein
VDFDPYATTTQADMLTKLGITVDSDAYGLLPTYDPTGADMAREAYDLRGESFGLQKEALGLRGEGLSASLATARRGSTGSLFDLTKQTLEKQGGTGFAGSGAGAQAMTNVRGDIISGFGDVSSDIGRRREGIAGELSGIGIDESQSYLDLQQDIWGMHQGYESDLLGAIGDLSTESWSYDANTSTTDAPYVYLPVDCHGKCSVHQGTGQYSACIQQCEDDATGGEITCPDGFILSGSECVDPNQYDGECPSGWYFDDSLGKCQQGSGSGSGSDRP